MKIKKKKKISAPTLPLGVPAKTKGPPSRTGTDSPLVRATDYCARERMLFQHETEDLLKWGTVQSLDDAAQMIRAVTQILAAMPRRAAQEGSHGRSKSRR